MADYETGLNVQLWKSYSDQFAVTLIHPNGNRREVIAPIPGSNQFQMENTTVLVYYGEPSPYSRFQEIYFELLPEENS